MLSIKSFNSINIHKYLVMSICPGQSFTQHSSHRLALIVTNMKQRTKYGKNYYTVPLRSLESPSGFSISARVNFRLVFWLPKFENLTEINADLISSSKLNCLFAEFFFDFFLRGVYLKRMQPKYGITASTPMLSYEKTLKFNMLFSPPIFKLGHLNFNWW